MAKDTEPCVVAIMCGTSCQAHRGVKAPEGLIVSASVGAGHLRAAEVIRAALQRTSAPVTVANYDVLALIPPALRRVYRDWLLPDGETRAGAPRLALRDD